MPPASAGSHAEPVAYDVHWGKSRYLAYAYEKPSEMWSPQPECIPLYRSPALTDEEREAIETAAMIYEQGAKHMGHVEDGKRAVALLAMLERLG